MHSSKNLIDKTLHAKDNAMTSNANKVELTAKVPETIPATSEWMQSLINSLTTWSRNLESMSHLSNKRMLEEWWWPWPRPRLFPWFEVASSEAVAHGGGPAGNFILMHRKSKINFLAGLVNDRGLSNSSLLAGCCQADALNYAKMLVFTFFFRLLLLNKL